MKSDDFLRLAVTVFLILIVSTLSYSDPRVLAESGGSAAQPPTKSAPQDFSVKTWKAKKNTIAHGVQLMSPPHRATYTPGVITFQWKLTLNSKKRKKFHFFIESQDGKTKIDRKTNNEKRLMSIGPGQYKWRVVADAPKADSRWRSFKVIKLKSDELTRLYEGRSNRKPTAAGMPQFSEAIVVDEGDPTAEGEPDSATPPAPGAPAPASVDPAPTTNAPATPAMKFVTP